MRARQQGVTRLTRPDCAQEGGGAAGSALRAQILEPGHGGLQLVGADLMHARVFVVAQLQRQALHVAANGVGAGQRNDVVVGAVADQERLAVEGRVRGLVRQGLGQQAAVPAHGGAQQRGLGQQQVKIRKRPPPVAREPNTQA